MRLPTEISHEKLHRVQRKGANCLGVVKGIPLETWISISPHPCEVRPPNAETYAHIRRRALFTDAP